MTSTRVLLDLTQRIQESTAKVDKYIEDNNLPEPTFEAFYPPILRLSPEADAARRAALEALDELRAHLQGPLGMVMHHVGEMSQLVSLHGMTAFGIPSALPADGSTTSIADIATKTGMHPDDTKTLIRHASSRHLVSYLPGERVAHNAASQVLTIIPGIAGVMNNAATIWRSAASVVDVMQHHPGSQDLAQSGYSRAHNTPLSFFDHLATDPEREKGFAESMTFLTSSPGLEPTFVLEYDWAQHAGGTVVDVGGSHGHAAFLIAERFGDLKLVVQDRPEVVATAPTTRHANVSFEVHDFLEPQVRAGVDVYFLRFIFHDWPTAYCLRILRALVPGLKHGARVVIMDAIVPEPGVLGKLDERAIAGYDIIMKALFNAKERSESEWRELVTNADAEGKFEIVEFLQPEGSQLGFVVIEWMG
ncbi:hypothetical protein N0V95_002640 [Ascochyta clinopodiicola]|nr:hypothetical protein N0V95_002640 [Ascochyta clinopodiicola]